MAEKELDPATLARWQSEREQQLEGWEMEDPEQSHLFSSSSSQPSFPAFGSMPDFNPIPAFDPSAFDSSAFDPTVFDQPAFDAPPVTPWNGSSSHEMGENQARSVAPTLHNHQEADDLTDPH
ncbi:hypothetical protein HBH70_146090 [Parastagonospora nodorum]|nr:hypothetical protein HBH53_114980 [Parastagonospora nodorum]KAH3968994.1 hypothetical protein HBH52_174890 [Parastagonospora nodorum]KAH4079366.1 hypothetical protein HBH46_233860 [Parastagonospora nodorum]KAH4112902.1 hypothetical protein HBH47_217520 [Parastagonospora nodorum]KAH4292871.1 hypothetical protein HBI01_175930 [Parastagonospora nodorum]